MIKFNLDHLIESYNQDFYEDEYPHIQWKDLKGSLLGEQFYDGSRKYYYSVDVKDIEISIDLDSGMRMIINDDYHGNRNVYYVEYDGSLYIIGEEEI